MAEESQRTRIKFGSEERKRGLVAEESERTRVKLSTEERKWKAEDENFGNEVKIRHQEDEGEEDAEAKEEDMEVEKEPDLAERARAEDSVMNINHVTMSEFWGTWAVSNKEHISWEKGEKEIKTVLSGYNQTIKD